ncbi:DUF4199 domain-containing protein [Microvirga sp. STS02]|uniref:DUF4199 domain-containing protein n=1 Tax=Hymenobacter negativus TaxID=2795026 RepID=UPI0018DBFF2B|nr:MULTISPECIES: DUF4199 domain-containing protein [Bacteria]MBH8570893.1 DUF4199 domain-containing protein [Hymenobacter negativus]MBR7210631.1 DUF4199 domain-containing protein [Microvirga sp. STS02]
MADAYQESNTTEPGEAAGQVFRLALRFGVGVGLVCALWMAGLQMTGSNGFGPKQLLAQLLVPLTAVASEWMLRRQLQPQRPGLGRSLGVGTLTVLIAALISASSLVGLAHGAGEAALARHRDEVLEIVRAQQRENPKAQLSEQAQQQQVRNVANLSVGDMAISNFTQVLMLGLVLAIPAGIFLRE